MSTLIPDLKMVLVRFATAAKVLEEWPETTALIATLKAAVDKIPEKGFPGSDELFNAWKALDQLVSKAASREGGQDDLMKRLGALETIERSLSQTERLLKKGLTMPEREKELRYFCFICGNRVEKDTPYIRKRKFQDYRFCSERCLAENKLREKSRRNPK